MKLPPYVKKRGSVYWFRRRVPEDLIPIVGRAEFVESLKTSELAVARTLLITSDEAFDFQLARQVVRLAPANAGAYWDQSKGRARSVYRDIPPRVIKALVVPLKEAFGAAGLMLASKEREEDQRKAEDRRRLEHALGGLQ